MADTASLTIWEALNKVKTAVGAVGKNERNTMQNFSFRGVDSVVNAAAPHLNNFGVIVTPEVLEHLYETVEIGQKKTPMAHVTLAVRYTFWGPAGDSVSSTVLAEAMDSGDKACAKAMSVAYRIALLQTLNLPTDEPDPDSESFERASAETTPAQGTRLNGKAESNRVPEDWGKAITATKSIGQLRGLWKQAGEVGKLQDQIVVNSESMTVQDYLYKRSDQLAMPKSN
jgi:ERF superfamily